MPTLPLPDRRNEPADPEQRAAWRRAVALSQRFAEAAWILSAPLTAPVQQSEDMAVLAREAGEQIRFSDAERSAALEEIEAATLALEKTRAPLYSQQLSVLRALSWVAVPDQDFGGLAVEDALRRLAEQWPGLRIDPEEFASVAAEWRRAERREVKRARQHLARSAVGTQNVVWAKIVTLFTRTFGGEFEADTLSRLWRRHFGTPRKRRRSPRQTSR